MDVKYILNPAQSNNLYTMMKFIHDTLVKHHIPYFICGGTLLGAVRHQGIIPHDDDGDICIFKQDVPKLRKLIKYFDSHGYDLEEGKLADDEKPAACGKVKDSCTWFIAGKGPNSLGCDVFVMEVEKNGTVNYADPYWKHADNGGKRCYFKLEHVFPLIPYRYGNFFLYGPRNPILHLNTCYGDDWNSKGQTLYDHRTGAWTRGKKRTLTADDYLTLKPPTKTLARKSDSVVCRSKQGDCASYRKSRKTSRKSSRKSSHKSSRKSSRKRSKKYSRKSSRR
jgi:hypothetical protein